MLGVVADRFAPFLSVRRAVQFRKFMLLFPEQLVEQIHDSPGRIVLAVTGGSRAIADLLEVPGGSRTLLEAVVPYSSQAMSDWLGGEPDEFCSAATARAMAMAAFQRARKLDALAVLPIGAACTASLASDRPKRGPHRIHVALQTQCLTASWHLPLQKDRRSRLEEERLAGRLLLNVLAEACGIADRLTLELLEGEPVEESRTVAPQAWQDLLLGRVESVLVGPVVEQPKIVFPGAFNPCHTGHRRMAAIAQEWLHEPAVWEITASNVDKPPLDFAEIERRLAQFSSDEAVYLTMAATFEEKSRLFPNATFVVGADTLQRIADPKYYGGSSTVCQSVFEQIAGRNCRFLVYGRTMGGNFMRLGDLSLPETLRALCREVPPEVFREDISSTEIRKAEG